VERHPETGDPITLRDPAGREYVSRVQDLGNGLVVVARPRDLPPDDVLAAGTDVDVAWADADGVVTVLPTRILAAHAAGDLPVWSLAVTGPAFNEQRRRSDRVAAAGPVVVRAAAAKRGGVNGALVDLSEGGVRCAVAAGTADQFLAGRADVVAEFRLGSVDFAIPGRVEFLRPTRHPAQLEEMVVVFDDPVPDAEELRAQVAALGAESLQAGDEGGR
jgi:c-di-GMP-binding flagellar brake protein YcgR